MRSDTHRRWVALALLTVVVAALTATWRAASAWKDARTPGPAPERVDHGTAPTLAERVWTGERRADQPVVVMYVRESCPYCRAELRHWAALFRDRTELRSTLELVVVSADSATAYASGFMPDGLAHRRIYDLEGRIADELGVAAVPYTLYLAPDGRVAASTLGETHRPAIEAAVDSLLEGGSW